MVLPVEQPIIACDRHPTAGRPDARRIASRRGAGVEVGGQFVVGRLIGAHQGELMQIGDGDIAIAAGVCGFRAQDGAHVAALIPDRVEIPARIAGLGARLRGGQSDDVRDSHRAEGLVQPNGCISACRPDIEIAIRKRACVGLTDKAAGRAVGSRHRTSRVGCIDGAHDGRPDQATRVTKATIG